MNVTDHAHRGYLAAALAAELAAMPEWGEFVGRWTDRYQGWSGIIEQIRVVSEELAELVEDGTIVWGETHDQYLALEVVARFIINDDQEPFAMFLPEIINVPSVKITPPKPTPSETLALIHGVMTGVAWSPDTLDAIATILNQHGWKVEPPTDEAP